MGKKYHTGMMPRGPKLPPVLKAPAAPITDQQRLDEIRHRWGQFGDSDWSVDRVDSEFGDIDHEVKLGHEPIAVVPEQLSDQTRARGARIATAFAFAASDVRYLLEILEGKKTRSAR